MDRKPAFVLFLCFVTLALGACSGLQDVGGKGGGAGGGGTTGTLSLTLMDTPPTGASVLSFRTTITGVSLMPASGSPVTLNLSPTSPVVELTRLQSDSALLGSFSLASGTYTGMNVGLASPDVVIYNQTGSALQGALAACPNNSVCEFKSALATVVTITFASKLTVSSTAPQGLALDFNFADMLTFSNGTLSVDFSQPNALTAASLPRTGEPSGTLDLIEDFTGVVTAVNQSTGAVTIQSGTRGTLTATANSSTTYNDPQSLCTGGSFALACLANKVNLAMVSADTALNPNGSLTLLELDLLNLPSTSQDEVEGTVYLSNGSNQFSMILADEYVENTTSPLAGAAAGEQVNATINAGTTFLVDPKNLGSFTSLTGFTSASDLVNGQTVMVHAVSATTGTNGVISVTTDRLMLRYTRVTGSVSLVSDPTFTILNTSLPAFFPTFTNSPLVQTYPAATVFDNVNSGTIGGLAVNDTVSIRALFLNPGTAGATPFLAAKVRKH
jgi:hypothetical protein